MLQSLTTAWQTARYFSRSLNAESTCWAKRKMRLLVNYSALECAVRVICAPKAGDLAYREYSMGRWAKKSGIPIREKCKSGECSTARSQRSSTANWAAQRMKVRVGVEARGHARWFERLLAELNFELWSEMPPRSEPGEYASRRRIARMRS